MTPGCRHDSRRLKSKDISSNNLLCTSIRISQLPPKSDFKWIDKWFPLLLETMNEGLAVQDENGLIIYTNNRFCEMLGYSHEDLMGSPLSQYVDEANQTIVNDRLTKPGTGEDISYEMTLTAKNGHKIHTLVSPRSLFDEEGQCKGSITLFVDITERDQAAKQILKLDAAVEQSSVAVLISDKEGNIEYVNPKFTQLTGHTAKELIGANPRIFQSGKTPIKTYNELWQAITTGKTWEGEIQNKKKNGEFYWAFEKIAPVRNEAGEIIAFVAAQEDITRRKLAEEKLKASQKKYSMLVEKSSIGIYLVQEGRIRYANSKLSEIFGYSKDALLGMELFDIIHPEYRKGLPDLLSKQKAEGAALGERIQGVKKNGEVIWIRLANTLIHFGEKAAILGNVVDMTQEKRTEESLSDSRMELRNLSSQLLSAQEQERKRISSELHDGVGQYLSSIKFSMDNIGHNCEQTDPASSSAIRKLIPIIQEAIDEVRRLSMDLRPSMLDDLGILATLSWFCRRYQTVFSHIRIETHINIKEDEVPADLKTVIYRIVQEALNNVAKHAVANLVQLCLSKSDDTIELIVQDNGQGFEMAKMARGYSEAGIGFLSMRERAELSGGSFTVDSKPGLGVKIRASWKLQENRTLEPS